LTGSDRSVNFYKRIDFLFLRQICGPIALMISNCSLALTSSAYTLDQHAGVHDAALLMPSFKLHHQVVQLRQVLPLLPLFKVLFNF
jgi:hypothetical protein